MKTIIIAILGISVLAFGQGPGGGVLIQMAPTRALRDRALGFIRHLWKWDISTTREYFRF